MKSIYVVVVAAGVLVAGPGLAQSGADVVKAKGCLGCHDYAVKKVGPSFKDVAAKYKGDAKAVETLVGKLKAGKAHPKAPASDVELKSAVEHLLATK